MRLWLAAVAALSMALGYSMSAEAQAVAAGRGPGPHVMAGGGLSIFQSDYGQRQLGGVTLWGDANISHRWGIEGEARWLRLHNDPNGSNQSTYLAGPRFNLMTRSVRPYAKGLVGIGHFKFPFGYANGTYFVAAPGGGVEWHHKRFAVKVVDVEYQMWPQFSYGAIHPYGISTGITFRLWQGKSMMSEE